MLKEESALEIFLTRWPSLAASTMGEQEKPLPPQMQEWKLDLPLNTVKIVLLFGLDQEVSFWLSWLEEDRERRLLLFEEEKGLWHSFLKLPEVARLLSNKQVRCDEGSYPQQIDALSWEFFSSPTLFIQSPSYSQKEKFPQKRAQFYAECAIKRSVCREFLQDFGGPFYDNYYKNLKTIAHSCDGFALKQSLKDIPALVCAGGPSLIQEREVVRRFSQHALVLAAGSAITQLEAAAIRPHMTAATDPYPQEFWRHFYHNTFEVPHSYKARWQHNALALTQGPKVYFSRSRGYSVVEWFDESLGIHGEGCFGGIFSSHFALDVARILGCNPIILLGFDFARPTKMAQELPPWESFMLARQPCIQKGKQSTWEWTYGARWVEEYVKYFPSRSFYNASSQGLSLLGVKSSSVEEILQNKPCHDIEGRLHASLQQVKLSISSESIQERQKQLQNEHKEGISSLQSLLTRILQLERKWHREGFWDIAEYESIENTLSDLRETLCYHTSLRMFEWIFDRAVCGERGETRQKNIDILVSKLRMSLQALQVHQRALC